MQFQNRHLRMLHLIRFYTVWQSSGNVRQTWRFVTMSLQNSTHSHHTVKCPKLLNTLLFCLDFVSTWWNGKQCISWSDWSSPIYHFITGVQNLRTFTISLPNYIRSFTESRKFRNWIMKWPYHGQKPVVFVFSIVHDHTTCANMHQTLSCWIN